MLLLIKSIVRSSLYRTLLGLAGAKDRAADIRASACCWRERESEQTDRLSIGRREGATGAAGQHADPLAGVRDGSGGCRGVPSDRSADDLDADASAFTAA